MPWASIGTPDGGDGDIKSGINFYWTEEYSGIATRHEVFYYWTLPFDDEQLTDTQAPEELFLNPEEFDMFPMEIQDGELDWKILDPPED